MDGQSRRRMGGGEERSGEQTESEREKSQEDFLS